MSDPWATPNKDATRRLMAGPIWPKIAAAFGLGLLVVWLVPEAAAGDPAQRGAGPPVGLLLTTGVLVGAVVIGALYLALSRDLKLPAAAVVYAIGFNAVVALVKFTFAAEGIYEVNREVAITSYLNISDPIGAAGAALLVLLLYVGVYGILYRVFRK